MMICESAKLLLDALTSGFLMILADLYSFDVLADEGSWELTRKGSQVQTLSPPPYPP
jgi:hypothetical protein